MSLIDRLYSHLWTVHGDELAILDQSLAPRSFEYMYTIAAELGFGVPRARVLDAGCGRGNHSVELARRFGCEVVGFDLVFAPIEAAAQDAELPRGVRFVQASMSRLPLRDGTFDFVWCRDMLVHLTDLDAAMRECSRVLRPSGKMLVYCTSSFQMGSGRARISSKRRRLSSRRARSARNALRLRLPTARSISSMRLQVKRHVLDG